MICLAVILTLCLVTGNEGSLFSIQQQGYGRTSIPYTNNYRCSCTNGINQIPFDINNDKWEIFNQMFLNPNPLNDIFHGIPALPYPQSSPCASGLNPYDTTSTSTRLGMNLLDPFGLSLRSKRIGIEINPLNTVGNAGINPFAPFNQGNNPLNSILLGANPNNLDAYANGFLGNGFGGQIMGQTPMLYSGLNVKSQGSAPSARSNLPGTAEQQNNQQGMAQQGRREVQPTDPSMAISSTAGTAPSELQLQNNQQSNPNSQTRKSNINENTNINSNIFPNKDTGANGNLYGPNAGLGFQIPQGYNQNPNLMPQMYGGIGGNY